MKSKYLALALLLTLPAFGQITARKTFPFVDRDTLANKPSSCVFPSFFQASDTGTLYQCYGGIYVIIATGTGPTTINGVTIGSESIVSGFGFPSSIDILQNNVTHNFFTARPIAAPSAGLYMQLGSTGNAYIGQNSPGAEGGGSIGWLIDGSIQIFPLASNPIISVFGHLRFNTDNTFDIGAAGANRPRDLNVARGINSGQSIDASTFAGTHWTDKVVTAYGSAACSSGCTIIVPDSIADDGHTTTPSIPSNVTLRFSGSATFGFCQITLGKFSKIYNNDAVLQMQGGGSGCSGLTHSSAASMQEDDKTILDGVRIDCNNQTTSAGITFTGGSAQDSFNNVSVQKCGTSGGGAGIFLQDQFGHYRNITLQQNYVNLKMYETNAQRGVSSNTFYDLKTVSPGSGVNIIMTNTATSQPFNDNVFINLQSQNGTICDLAIFGTSATNSKIALVGYAPELGGGGAASITIDGNVIKRSTFYASHAIVELDNGDNNEGSSNPSFLAENNSQFLIKNLAGYGNVGGDLVLTDATSTVALIGAENAVGEVHGVTQYPSSLASQQTKGFRMNGAPILTYNKAFPNKFAGNPQTPVISSLGAGATQSTAIDTTYGLVTTVTHAASAGSAGTNDANFGNLLAAPLAVAEDIYLSFLAKASVNVGNQGSCSTTGYEFFGGGSNFSDVEACLLAGQWTRVVIYLPNQNASTNIGLDAFPLDSSGATVSFTGFEALSVVAQSQNSANLIGVASSTGATGPNTYSQFLSTARLGGDFTTDGTTNFQTIGGLGASPLQWTMPSLPFAYKVSFTCDGSYLQLVANDTVSFGIQAATNSPTNIFGTGFAFISGAGALTPGTLATLSTTTATAIVAALPTGVGGQFPFHLAGTIENPANTANVFNIMVKTNTGADLVTVRHGSFCTPTVN